MLEASTHLPNLPNVGDSDYPENARRILEAGLEKFARKGYAATSVREIVRAADVTNPMLYYYFDSKEGLFVALIDYLFESMTTRLTETIERSDSFDEALEEIIWLHMEACLERPVTLRFIYFVLFGPPESTPDYDIESAQEEMISSTAALMTRHQSAGEFEMLEGYDLEVAVARFFSLISQQLMGAIKQADYADSPEEAERAMNEQLNREACRELKDFYLRGLGAD